MFSRNSTERIGPERLRLGDRGGDVSSSPRGCLGDGAHGGARGGGGARARLPALERHGEAFGAAEERAELIAPLPLHVPALAEADERLGAPGEEARRGHIERAQRVRAHAFPLAEDES